MGSENHTEQISAFLRVFIPRDNYIRSGFAMTCEGRWRMDEGVNLTILRAYTVPYDMFVSIDPNGFHVKSKQKAEELAKTDIYIVADDDCLVIGKDFARRGVEIMKRHPEFGILTATSISDGPYPFINDDLPEVVKMHAVGGVAFVRKGILTDFEDCPANKIDHVICDEFQRKGYKTGIMPHLRFNHLGCGFSIVDERFSMRWNRSATC